MNFAMQCGKHVGQNLFVSICIDRDLCDVSASEVYKLDTSQRGSLTTRLQNKEYL